MGLLPCSQKGSAVLTAVDSAIAGRQISRVLPLAREPQLEANAGPFRGGNLEADATEISRDRLGWAVTRRDVVAQCQRRAVGDELETGQGRVGDQPGGLERQALLLEGRAGATIDNGSKRSDGHEAPAGTVQQRHGA